MSYIAVTFIGCRVSRDKVYRKQRVRVCNLMDSGLNYCHLEQSDMDFANFKACPFCASPIWKEKEEYIGDDGESYVKVLHPVAVTVDIVNIDYDNPSRGYLVGHKITSTYTENKPVLTTDLNLLAWREKLEPAMQSIGLWDEESYGLYTLLLVR